LRRFGGGGIGDSAHNLHPDQASYLRGKRYNAEKQDKGGDRKSKDQNDPLPESTADRLATEYKVSAPTIKRDGNYAAAVDTLQAAGIAPQAVIAHEPKSAVVEFAKLITPEPELPPSLPKPKDPLVAAMTEKVIAGQMTVMEAAKEIRQVQTQRRKEDRIADIQRQAAAIAESEPEVPAGPFHVISIDPPWPYGTQYDPNGRRAANPYPEMSLEEIEALQLPAADDCVLWLWTTHKFMRDSFKLLDTWGFRDVAIVTWAKDRMGLGSWLRSQSEFCIMAVKGKPPVRLTNQTTIIDGPLREHSRKPDSFYELVNSLCVGAKLDYFSREKREGWAQVGNTTDLFEVSPL